MQNICKQKAWMEAAVSLGQGDIEKFLFRVFHGTVDSVAILIANFITSTKKTNKKKKNVLPRVTDDITRKR